MTNPMLELARKEGHRPGLPKTELYPSTEKLAKRREEVLSVVRRHPGSTQTQLARYMGTCRQVARADLEILARQGKVHRAKDNRYYPGTGE